MAFLAFLYIVLCIASFSMAFGAGEANEIAVNLGVVAFVVGIALSVVVLA
ncbi:MAG: hypothetical protein ACXVHX_22795 [Solirubrobacteraceae bacterium]